MTTLVKGPIKLVTDRPDTVREVNIRASELRLHGAGIVTDHNDDIPVRDGQVEFSALPGPAVLTLVTAGGAPLRSVDIVVPDEDTATLAECLDQIYVYDPPVVGRAQQFAREAGEYAARAEAGAARVGSAEQVGAWVGEAEVLHDDTVAAAEHAETQAGIAAEQAGVAAGHAEQAGADRAQTGADRRQTGEDRAQTGEDREAAEGWASQSKDAATLAITSAAALERHIADRDPTDDDTAYKGAIWVAPDQVWIRGEESWHPISVNEIDKNYVDAQDTALRQRIDAEKWGKPSITTGSIDGLLGRDAVGTRPVASQVTGTPVNVSGYLDVRYDPQTGSTTHLFLSSNPLYKGSWKREYWGGGWREWVNSEWVQPSVTATDLNDVLAPGVRPVMTSPANRPPGAGIGILETFPFGNGVVHRYMASDRMWTRRTAGGVFQPWVEFATMGAVTAAINQAIEGLVPSEPETTDEWIKRVPLAVTTGAGAGAGPGSGRYRTRVRFGAPVLRWKLHVSTRYPIFTTIRGGATITDVSIGANAGAGQVGETTPILTGAQTIPAGEEWVSDWIAYDLTADSLIDMTVDVPGEHYNLLAPAWKQNADGTWTQVNRGPLWVWIEAETFDTTPTVALIGDSTGAGHGSIEPVWDSAVAIAGREQGFLPVLFASSGDTLSGNIALDDPNFARWADYGPYDSVVIQAGSNDLNTGATLAEMQDRFTKVAAVAQKLAPVVVGATIKPRYPTDTVGEVRVPYNDWLRSRPDGVWTTLDYSAAVAPDGTVAAEDNDDGAHLKKSGHEKMAIAYDPVRIARPRLADDPDEDTGPQITIDTNAGERIMLGDHLIAGETGTRDVSHLLVNATGSLTIYRTGNTVFMDAQGVTPTDGLSSGGTFVGNLPSGFRPTMRRDFALPLSLTSTGYRSAFQFASGAIGVWSPSTSDKYYLHLSWNTTDAWPTTLPGTPA